MKPIKLSAWSNSAQGRPIDLYHAPAPSWERLERPIVVIGGVHGDEPEGVFLAEALVEWLYVERNLASVKVPWIVIPCLNPDGYALRQRVNGNGVDLNRNYPSSNWSPAFAEPKYNPGTSPGSEPETQAVVRIVAGLRPRLVIHCHSWRPCIVCTGDAGLTDAGYLAESSGYEIVSTIGYPTPGSLSHYGWTDHGIPVICTEEAERVDKATTWSRFGRGLQRVLADPSPRGSR